MALALLAIAVFISAAALDYATASYFSAVAKRRRHQAARWSVAMAALGLVGAASAFKISLWYIIPEFAGLYIGTIIAIPKED